MALTSPGVQHHIYDERSPIDLGVLWSQVRQVGSGVAQPRFDFGFPLLEVGHPRLQWGLIHPILNGMMPLMGLLDLWKRLAVGTSLARAKPGLTVLTTRF